MGKALDAEERLHVCFTINASIISVKHFTCDLFHFRYLFKMRYSSLKCAIIFVVRKQVLCHYFNELYFFVVYKVKIYKTPLLYPVGRRHTPAASPALILEKAHSASVDKIKNPFLFIIIPSYFLFYWGNISVCYSSI